MTRTILFVSAVTLCCILTVRAEPPVTSYSISGDRNGYDYSNAISNGAYIAGKDAHKENADYYNGGNNGHTLIGSGSQSVVEGGLGSASYSGFSPSAQNSGFRGYAAPTPDSHPGNSYTLSGHGQSSFGGYTSGTTNGDSTFEGYATGGGQGTSSVDQYPTNAHKTQYVGFSETSGAAGSYSDTAAEGTFYRGHAGAPSRGPSMGAYLENDHGTTSDSAYFSSAQSAGYPAGKLKESVFGAAAGGKYSNDVYSAPSDVRFVQGGHAAVQPSREYASSPVYISSPMHAAPFAPTRGAALSLYGSGKMNKYASKHLPDYALATGTNYLSRDHESEYLPGGYTKGSGKVILIKDGRPSNYGGQAYVGAPSYLAKLMAGGSYKSKTGGFSSYPSLGYSSMSSLHGNFGGGSYGEGHIPRGYRGSAGYVSGGAVYPSYS